MNRNSASRSVITAVAALLATGLVACTSNPNKTGAERTGEKVNHALTKTGDVVGNAAETTGDVVSDSWITTKVKSQLVADDLVKAREINVTTNEGVVTLAGLVGSNAERARAIKIANDTKGVKKVNTKALKVG